MQAKEIYKKLDNDFIKLWHSDYWIGNMSEIESYLTENFKEQQMWLVCDFTDEINQIFTAVFPSKKVVQQIINSGAKNAMLFLHHPMIWDIRERPVFKNIDSEALEEFKKNNISIYALHVPLDDFWEYSTSNNLAKVLDIEVQEKFMEYFWSMAWVIWDSKNKSIEDIKNKLEELTWHEIKVYNYGHWTIKDNKVAIIAWWWLTEWIEEIKEKWINLFITGISNRNPHSENAHQIAEENGITIIWWTHYSTEKFACMEMIKYFEKLWIQSEFIWDDPVLEDM